LIFEKQITEGVLYKYLKCLDGFLHLKPTAGYQISTLIFDFHLWRGGLYKYLKDGKVLDHLECQLKVFPGPLADLSAWMGFCTSSPQQGVKYHH
jgi:hypothetical protein